VLRPATGALDEIEVRRHGAPVGVILQCAAQGVGVNRYTYGPAGELARVQQGAARPPSDIGSILRDLEERLDGRPLATHPGALFPVTGALIDRLRQELAGDDVQVGLVPDPGLGFDADRIILAGPAAAEVEVVVAEYGAWIRVDGEDAPAHDHDRVAELVEEALGACRARHAGPAPT